jgi:predicted glycoside hydrolase/deacetylase ChbG (UPF0249 family)
MKLVFNADDFGSHPTISRGIIQAIKRGVVRSTTVMANMVDDESLSALAALSQVSVGVHLNLTKGKPLTSLNPRYLEGGKFSRAKMYFPEGAPLLRERVIRAEFEAQVGRLADAGIAITHLDSHQNIHSFVNVLDVAADIALERGLAMRTLSPAMSAYLDWKGVRHPAMLISGFFGKNNIGEVQLLSLLNSVRGKDGIMEVMCHPGLTAGLPREHTEYYEEREQELTALCSSGLKAWLEDNSVHLADYDDV